MDGEMDTWSHEDGGHLPVPVTPEVEGGQVLLPPQEIETASSKVFGNHLLREIMFNHAIQGQNPYLGPDRLTVSSFRAVRKDWNDSVCGLLHKNAQHLHTITLGALGTVDFKWRKRENPGELLDKLAKTFACSVSVLGCTPTFELSLEKEAFRQENYESLYNFLVSCGPGLVEIKVKFPMYGNSMNGTFPTLSLPSLQKAGFHIDDTRLEGQRVHIDILIHFLQSIFTGAKALKELRTSHYPTQLSQSSVFESVTLPPSLEFLGLPPADLEILLLKNDLPNLTSINLFISRNSMADGLLSRILEKVRWKLKKLRFVSNLSAPTRFVFPVMEKLEVLKLDRGGLFHLEPGIRCLERCFPKLRLVNFCYPTSGMFGRWTISSRFAFVVELNLKCSSSHSMSLDQECMHQIYLAFPNLTKLELTFVQIPVAGLQYMFTRMTKSVNLKMQIMGGAYEQRGNDWDSRLIGKPVELTATLRETPAALWDNIQWNDDEDSSIRKLTRLRTLSLQDDTYGRRANPFITDVSFQFGFLKMPRLQSLHFSNSFAVSQEMADNWRAAGRFLRYTEYAQHP